MPPKRIVKNNLSKPKPPTTLVSIIDHDSKESTEAELKFDQEVLWCISQFEKLISSGKLPEQKKQESIRAVNTLRKASIQKIQKIQIMKQYFKDYKTKMLKDEELQKSLAQEAFQATECEPNKAIFVKKKSEAANIEQQHEEFKFNFKDPKDKDLESVNKKMSSVELR